MPFKPILRECLREARHVPVTAHFSNNGSGGNQGILFIAADDCLLKRKCLWRAEATVKQHSAGFRRNTKLTESPADSECERGGEPYALNTPLPDKRSSQPTFSPRFRAVKALCPPLPLSS
jgi:hypothetical protein